MAITLAQAQALSRGLAAPIGTTNLNDFWALQGLWFLVAEGGTQPIPSATVEDLFCSFDGQETVKERSTRAIDINFTTEEGVPTAPESVTIRIDDEASGVAIRASAPYVAGELIRLRVTAEENRILDPRNPSETRIVTVSWTYNGTTGNDEYRYRVKNLFGV
jgi:hypothetical protein